MKFSREFEGQADYLAVQYMYKAGYDPQSFVSFFEKLESLEKRKPGLISKAFEDHPPTPDRIEATQREIARILPARRVRGRYLRISGCQGAAGSYRKRAQT
jgi:predicted Zn-dependent protease